MTEDDKHRTTLPTVPVHVKPLKPDEVTTTAQTTPGSGPDTLSNAAAPEFSYLEPPQSPDELGRIGSYRVLRVLGQGGMGVVFEAEDPMLTRRVAIKVPLTEAADEIYLKRFLREARLAATLSSDHIATVFQAGQHGNVPFMVMELLRGESLSGLLQRQQTLPVGEALRIAREVAGGLREAHARGLVHRDIKPGNIFLEERGSSPGLPRVKILDFGVAREIRPKEGITSAGAIVGSMGYMAPEQIYAGEIDGRTDLFALGCVLFQMLTGRLPFSGSNTIASLKAVVNEKAHPTASAAPHLPAAVCQLVDDLLQKEPGARPASADVVIERIQEIERELARQSSARPAVAAPSPTDAGKKHAWGIIYGAGAIAVALIVGLFVLRDKLFGPAAEPDSGTNPGQAVAPAGPPIKIGILHSLSGPLASTEAPVADAIQMAVDEINRDGGILGRPIVPILVDGRSTDEGFAAGAKKLIDEDGVVAIFGCWTSACRKQVEKVCDERDNLLVYSLNFEGLEESHHTIYVGGGPNQQMIPATGWAVGEGKRKFFLVGSDSVFSRAGNAIMRNQLELKGRECVGEEYVPLLEVASSKFSKIAQQIKDSGADAVINTVDGHDANVFFFHVLAETGVKAKEIAIISFSFSETELLHLDERDSVGHYAVANYFESMTNKENLEFLKRFKASYPNRAVNDPIAASYSAVYLWKQAVIEAGDDEAPAVRAAMARQKFDGPEGTLTIDPATRYSRRTARVGRVVNNREFKVVFISPEPMAPTPFPATRTREEWTEFLLKLYHGWGDHWQAPGR